MFIGDDPDYDTGSCFRQEIRDSAIQTSNLILLHQSILAAFDMPKRLDRMPTQSAKNPSGRTMLSENDKKVFSKAYGKAPKKPSGKPTAASVWNYLKKNKADFPEIENFEGISDGTEFIIFKESGRYAYSSFRSKIMPALNKTNPK